MKLKHWTHAGGAVYDSDSGTRVHVMGMCRLVDGQLINGMLWPERRNLDCYIRIQGGNRKRGAMAWAQSKEATR